MNRKISTWLMVLRSVPPCAIMRYVANRLFGREHVPGMDYISLYADFLRKCSSPSIVRVCGELVTVRFIYRTEPLIFSGRWKSSDFLIAGHVFHAGIYDRFFALNAFQDAKDTILIDAGSNVGAVTLAASFMFQNLRIMAIEADPENFKILTINVEENKISKRVQCICAAIWEWPGKACLARDFRDGEAHAVRVVTDGEAGAAETLSEVTSIKLLDLIGIASSGHSKLLLKMDIEGAESAYFMSQNQTLSWFAPFTAIAIELHHESVDIGNATDYLLAAGLHGQMDGDSYIGERAMSASK